MGLFDSDEKRRRLEEERKNRLREAQRQKKERMLAQQKREKKRAKRMAQLKEISDQYSGENPFSGGGAPQQNGNSGSPPMSLNRGLKTAMVNYNRNTYASSKQGSSDSNASSSSSANDGLPKLNRNY